MTILQPIGCDPEHGLLWHIHRGEGPVVGLAVHAGHEIRPDLWPYLAIDEDTRLREEDPYTDYWTLACGTQIITRRSRFEVDLNRTESEAICIEPEECWNLRVWKEKPPQDLLERSLEEHRAFYTALKNLLKELEQEYGRFVVLDLHGYNHQRSGPDALTEDPVDNPDVNVGTGSLNRALWGPVVDHFIADLRSFEFPGGPLDVRENVKFYGRNIARFVHRRFPETGCVLAIEVKKFFMDEWTGKAEPLTVQSVLDALASTVPGIREELAKL